METSPLKLHTVRGHCHDIDARVNKWLEERCGRITVEDKEVSCARNGQDDIWYSVAIWYTEINKSEETKQSVLDELKTLDFAKFDFQREQKLDRGDENFYSLHIGK
jgi:hypothetical protein